MNANSFLEMVKRAEKHGWKLWCYRAWGAKMLLNGEESAACAIAIYYDGRIEIIR